MISFMLCCTNLRRRTFYARARTHPCVGCCPLTLQHDSGIRVNCAVVELPRST